MCASSAYAQISLMKDGKTKAKIILAEDSQMNRVAANLFQSFFQKITGKTLPVVNRFHKREIFLLENNPRKK